MKRHLISAILVLLSLASCSTISKTQADKNRLAVFLVGDADKSLVTDYGLLSDSFGSGGWEVREIARGEAIPADTGVLLVLGNADMDDYDTYRIDYYLAKGGRAIFAVKGVEVRYKRSLEAAPLANEALLNALESYGVVVRRALVLDESALNVNFTTTNSSTRQSSTEAILYPHWFAIKAENINKEISISDNRDGLYLFWPSPLLVPGEGDSASEIAVLASTTPYAWLQSLRFSVRSDERSLFRSEASATTGQYVVAVAESGKLRPYYKGKPIPTRQGAAVLPSLPAFPNPSKIIIVGSTAFASDLMPGANIANNAKIVVDASEWLIGDGRIDGKRAGAQTAGRAGTKTTSATENTAFNTNEIRIGGVAPVSGAAATFGISVRNGYEMAIAERNGKGGILGKQIKLVFADDRGDPTEGAAAYARLIRQDKVTAIIGTVMSKVSLVGAPIAQAAGVPMISPTSTNPRVTAVGDYIFRACFIDPFQGTVGARFSFNTLAAKKAAVLFDKGDEYTRGLAEYFKVEYQKLGGQVIAYEGYETGTTDFKAHLATMLVDKPDVLYVPEYYEDDALIAKQARELGYTGPIVGGDGWDSPDLVKIGGVAVENCFFTNHYSKDDMHPAVQEFVRKYQAKFGSAPDALAALGYEAMDIMLHAIEKAGTTDGAAIRDALKATDSDFVTGHISFDQDRNPQKSAVIIAIRNGQQLFFSTIDANEYRSLP